MTQTVTRHASHTATDAVAKYIDSMAYCIYAETVRQILWKHCQNTVLCATPNLNKHHTKPTANTKDTKAREAKTLLYYHHGVDRLPP